MSEDEELQRKIENKELTDAPDAKVYLRVFDALSQEDYRLPAGFADRVVTRAGMQGKLSNDTFWMIFGLISFAVAGIVTAVFLHFRIDFGSFKFISGYGGPIVFGLGCILALQWVDKNIIRKNLDFHN